MCCILLFSMLATMIWEFNFDPFSYLFSRKKADPAEADGNVTAESESVLIAGETLFEKDNIDVDLGTEDQEEVPFETVRIHYRRAGGRSN